MLYVTEIHNRPDFMSLQQEWNDLVESTRNAVNDRHEFFRIFTDSFFSSWKGVRILLAYDASRRLQGIFPLVRKWSLFYGLPVRRVSAAINHYFTRFDMIASNPEAVSEAFLRYLANDTGWDVLALSYIATQAHTWRLYEKGLREKFHVACHETLRSPFVTLPGSMDEIYARLKPKFRTNLRRRRLKLEKLGCVQLEKFTAGPALKEKLEAGLAIERSGWKGAEGTAISLDPGAFRFYTELAEEASRRGYLTLYFLKVDNRPVAFHFGLSYNRRYLFLKPGYDEGFREYGPGHLLVEEVLKDCIAQGFEEFDFLAENMPWKQEWTPEMRAHSLLYVFKNSIYGDILAELKSKGVPLAKRLIERISPEAKNLTPSTT